MEEINFMDVLDTLDNPEEFDCVVWRYQAGHSVMLVLVTKDFNKLDAESTFHLYFDAVTYFDGPMGWQGVNFYLGSDEECLEILNKIGFKDSELIVRTGYKKLFKIKLPNIEVKIIAGGVLKIDNMIVPSNADLLNLKSFERQRDQ